MKKRTMKILLWADGILCAASLAHALWLNSAGITGISAAGGLGLFVLSILVFAASVALLAILWMMMRLKK